MIGQIWLWFWLSCKRYARRAMFLAILFLLPVGAFLIRGLEKKEGTEIRIAVCVEPKDKGYDAKAAEPLLEWQLAEDLAGRSGSDTLFHFYLCENEDEVKAEVASRHAECGYVISAGLREKLDEKKYKRSIRVYSAPSTVTAKLSAEVVFAALVKRYDRELFLDYVAEGAAFAEITDEPEKTRLSAEADALYEAWSRDGGTFRFVYGRLDTAGDDADADRAESGQVADGTKLFPVRGIVAVYVFVIGLYSGVISLADEKRGVFLALPAGRRMPCRLAAMSGPVVLAALSGLAALASGGDFVEVCREIPAMAVYGAAVVIFTWLLCVLCRREEVLCCLIPFFLVGSLVFCPVIIDVGRYIPLLGAAGRLFLPWYYLRLW